MQSNYNSKIVLIETAGLGLSLAQELKENAPRKFPGPIAVKPEGDKLDRLVAQTAKMEAGQVYLPQNAPWLGDFLHELLGFPNGRHDDQVDSTTQALGYEIRHLPRHPMITRNSYGRISQF